MKKFLTHIIRDDWECGVAISKQECDLYDEYPAFFTYLLGHELGHLQACLTDITLHVHYCLIQCAIWDASKSRIEFPYELPHERLFDQYGIYIAERFFLRTKLNIEINQRLALPDCSDVPRLKEMLQLSGTKDVSGLRNEIVKFSRPYKSGLIECWKKLKKKDHDIGLRSFFDLIADYDALFEYSNDS